jgi:hypothetical protein
MDHAEVKASEAEMVDNTKKSELLDEAAMEAVMLMHRLIFVQQLTVLSELSSKTSSSDVKVDVNIPELLLKRAATSEETIRKDGKTSSVFHTADLNFLCNHSEW